MTATMDRTEGAAISSVRRKVDSLGMNLWRSSCLRPCLFLQRRHGHPKHDHWSGRAEVPVPPTRPALLVRSFFLVERVGRARILPLLDLAGNRRGRHFAHDALGHLRRVQHTVWELLGRDIG